MTSKVIVQKNSFAESLALVGRAVGNRMQLPILTTVLLSKDEGQLRLTTTDLTLGVSVWMDANMDGVFNLALPARVLTDMVNALSEPEIVFSANGKPEAALKCGAFKGTVKGMEGSEFPVIPDVDVSNGLSLDARVFKNMIQTVSFAASQDEARPVLNGALVNLDGKSITMVATDGFRLALLKADLPTSHEKKQLIIPATALKEVARILGAVKAQQVTLFIPNTGSQVILRTENVQIVLQLIDGKYPDYQAILPKNHKTRLVLSTAELVKACKQAGIVAREGSNVIRLHLWPANSSENLGKVQILAQSEETGASEVELEASIEGQELEIAFNVKFLLEALESISAGDVAIEMTASNAPALIQSSKDPGFLCVLMPMHLDGN